MRVTVQTCFSWMCYAQVCFIFSFLEKQWSSLFLMWWAERGRALTGNATSQSQAQRENLFCPDFPLSQGKSCSFLSDLGSFGLGSPSCTCVGQSRFLFLVIWSPKTLARSFTKWPKDRVMRILFSDSKSSPQLGLRWLAKETIKTHIFWETTWVYVKISLNSSF